MARSDMRADLDRAMGHIRLSAERKTAILQAAEGENNVNKKQWTFRTVLIAAALCAALAVTALAMSPTLRQALSEALGGYAPYSSEIKDGAVSKDQNVEIRVVSTLLDKSGGSVFLEAKDLTGERFDSDMPCVSYDPETHTALLERRIYLNWDDRNNQVSRAGGTVDGDGTYTMSISAIELREPLRVNGVTLPAGVITDKVLKTQPLGAGSEFNGDEDQPVLVPNQTPMKLTGTDWFTLSSAGFDRDGVLHIQVKLADGVYLNDSGMVFCGVSGAREEDKSFIPYVLKGGRYLDLYYPNLHFEKTEDVVVEEFTAQLYEKVAIRGDWELTFPVKLLPERNITVAAAVGDMKGMRIETLNLSAMGVRLQGTTVGLKNGGTLSGLPAFLHLKDGTAVKLERGSSGWSNTGNGTGNFDGEYSLQNPVNPANVTGFSVGYWMIPIEGNTAKAGHWLNAIPGE